jgi:hypothetical protein
LVLKSMHYDNKNKKLFVEISGWILWPNLFDFKN